MDEWVTEWHKGCFRWIIMRAHKGQRKQAAHAHCEASYNKPLYKFGTIEDIAANKNCIAAEDRCRRVGIVAWKDYAIYRKRLDGSQRK